MTFVMVRGESRFAAVSISSHRDKGALTVAKQL